MSKPAIKAAPIALALYKSKADIEAAIKAAVGMGETYQRELHKIACSVLQHMNKNKDVRVVNAFIGSVVDSVRVNALRSWFENFGALKYDVEGKCMVYDKTKTARLGEAMGNPFWKFKTEEAYVPMDVAKAVAQLLKRIQADATKTKRNHSKAISALEALAA